MTAPMQVWESRSAAEGDDLEDLRAAVRAYLSLPGARAMTPRQTAEARRLTPLERALEPAHTTEFRHL